MLLAQFGDGFKKLADLMNVTRRVRAKIIIHDITS
jgi:hypothetical protein